MRTQRDFIMAVIKQTARPENVFKLGEILKVAEENVITNIDFNVAKDYIPYIVEFDTANLQTAALPGTTPNWKKTNNVSIFVVDKVATQELIQELFYGVEETGSSTDENTTNANSTNIQTTKENLKIEVLNGSGVSKNLQKVVDELEGAGFKVTRTGSTNTTSKTVIMDKKNTPDSILNNIKTTIGIGNIQKGESSSSKVNVVIIIGKDYN